MKVEFPTAQPKGIPGLRRRGMVFFAVLCGYELNRKDRKGRKEMPAPRVQVETPAPPSFARSYWKGNSRRDCPACLVSFLVGR